MSTPLDPIDPFVAFADTLASLQRHMPARFQARFVGLRWLSLPLPFAWLTSVRTNGFTCRFAVAHSCSRLYAGVLSSYTTFSSYHIVGRFQALLPICSYGGRFVGTVPMILAQLKPIALVSTVTFTSTLS